MVKIRIDNRDLAYTIDSYQTFTMDDTDESTREWYTSDDAPDEFKSAGVTFDNFDDLVDTTYDHAGYIKHLATCSVDILSDELVDRWEYVNDDGANVRVYDEIVHGITLDKTTSPSFYNYTTDSYVATWELNTAKLTEWITARLDDFNKFVADEYDAYDRQYKLDKTSEEYDAEYVVISMLDYYTRTVYTTDEYTDAMYESTREGTSEYIQYELLKNKGE